MNRLEANRKIVAALTAAVEKYPDWRFHQLLQNIGLEPHPMASDAKIDRFYEESTETLEKMGIV